MTRLAAVEKQLHLINTTYGWNLGDDLIREGVLALLGLKGEPMVFINRAGVSCGGANVPLWKVHNNIPPCEELCSEAKTFVMAGTPEWLHWAEEFYQTALRRGIPILLVGVGWRQGNRRLLARCKPLIKGATVRDRFAKRTLRAAGIDARWFPDPAFHADYPRAEKDLSLVVNYRADGENGRNYSDGTDGYWREVAGRFGSEIDLVTVHEAGEYKRAAAIFRDTPIFFSSDYTDYKPIYSRTARYLGGRIHGAVPVVACGGTAWLVYRHQKIDAMQRAARLGETLHILTYDTEPPSALVQQSPGRMLRELETYRIRHKNYWTAIMKRVQDDSTRGIR